jgi:hypothetical protein
VLAALGACGDDPAASTTPDPAATDVDDVADAGEPGAAVPDDDGSDPPGPPDFEEAKAAHTKKLEEMDEYGRGLLESFESRVYCPARDGGLKRGTAVVSVRIGEREGAFHVTFDAAQPMDEQVTVKADPDTVDMPKGTDKQVKKWARTSFEGPYREVVHYLPPSKVLVTPSKDGKNRVVTAQPHKHEVQVSYSVDSRDLVMIRGTSVLPRAEIVHFKWEQWRGRNLLDEMTFKGTESKVEFEYDDKHPNSLVLMKRGRLTQGDHVFDAVFRYEGLEFGE